MWIGIIAGGPRSLETMNWGLPTYSACCDAVLDSQGSRCVPVRVFYGEGISSAVFRHPDATDEDVAQAVRVIDRAVEVGHAIA